jgi:hypothetical protein
MKANFDTIFRHPAAGETDTAQGTDDQFGKWTVILRSGTRWTCICECGTARDVLHRDLKSGRSRSCGCAGAAKTSARNVTHGRSKTPEYRAWKRAKDRCVNPKHNRYEDYGGRGIAMHPLWLNDFPAFLRELGPKPSAAHSLDRRDNGRGYEPGNCRWAIVDEQNNNKRSNHRLSYRGRELTAKQWSRELGLNYQTVMTRLYKGRSIQEVLFAGELSR